MKNLKEYINESRRNFTFNEHERDALDEILGYITGNIGSDEDIAQFNDLVNSFSDEEYEQVNYLYDLISNTETYPKINKSLIKDDIEILQIILRWIDERGLFEDMYELQDILEKIS